MNKSHYKSFLATLLIMVVGLSACKRADTPALTPITVQLLWVYDAQFAGFYAADQKGHYKAEGLAVTLAQGEPNVNSQKPVLAGEAQFGIAGADQLILAQSEGKPVRAIATIYRHSPVVFIALASSGITRPQEFVGKTIRVVANVIPSLRAMTTHVGIRPNQFTEVILPSDLTHFSSGKIPVWGVYLTSFVVLAKQAGYKLNIIYPDDYGVHFYADTIFATDDFIAKNPDLVRRFLRATFKGWTYAVENPTATASFVSKYNPDADTALETAKMISSLPLINTGEDYIGWMKPEIWAGMGKNLREQGVLKNFLDVKQVYTLQFLKEIYQK
ncbi:MAG: ABC transporter substrate-binding protein [Chloroflexota bacterium]